MKVLIIGGTRFIGPYVVRQLAEAGHQVYIFHRGVTNTNLSSGVVEIKGDRNEFSKYKEHFKAISSEVVIDMFPYKEIDAVNAAETFQSFAKRVVVLSSADVYQAYGRLIGIEKGDFTTGLLTETSALRTRYFPYREDVDANDWRYDYDKILVEKYYMETSPLPATILRLPMIYGPNDRQHRLSPYLKAIHRQQTIHLDPIEAQWKTARGFVENMAYAVTLAVKDDRAANQIYNVADDPVLTEYEWVQAIQKQCQSHVEIDLKSKDHLDFFPQQHLALSSEKIRRELGYKEIVSFIEGLKQTIKWEKENMPE